MRDFLLIIRNRMQVLRGIDVVEEVLKILGLMNDHLDRTLPDVAT